MQSNKMKIYYFVLNNINSYNNKKEVFGLRKTTTTKNKALKVAYNANVKKNSMAQANHTTL